MSETEGEFELHLLDNLDPLIHVPARLMIMKCLFVVESAESLFLMKMIGLTWGNLSSHLSKLEDAGYVVIKKSFRGKKPFTTVSITTEGRQRFLRYRSAMLTGLAQEPSKLVEDRT